VPLRRNDVDAAQAEQHAAAHATAPAVRLVAGPGTGKSATIEERVRWILGQRVSADSVYVVSFTRASAAELRERVQAYCARHSVAGAEDVSVTTLHSLALRVLRRAGLLAAYASGPMVLDEWELRYVFDAEFSATAGATPRRSAEIRREHEAFWSTGPSGSRPQSAFASRALQRPAATTFPLRS
jgi:superfamily I DNA/RNA helicase